METKVSSTGVLIIHPTQKWITAVDGAEPFRKALESAIDDGYLAVAVNLDGVEYADSTAIGAIIQGFKKITRAGGKMCLFHVGQEMEDFLAQTVLDRFIEIVGDEEAVDLHFSGMPKQKKKWWWPF